MLITICDSILPETQRFGQMMIGKHFSESDGEEYLLKLSEHPSTNVQLFATNYLEEYGAGSPQKLAELKLYFIRVLNAVNRGRVAKKRVYSFLQAEALKHEESAQVVTSIMERQSASVSVEDRAQALETMVTIAERWPEIVLPITISEYETREKAS